MQLPWLEGHVPLMLAPMQGLTNRAMRAVQHQIGRPDVLFTEFLRIKQATHHRISRNDRRESAAQISDTPLVVQLIGHTANSLAEAALMVQDQGVQHININMGCPFGRTTSGKTGGAMLSVPELLPECLAAVRKVVTGSFSVKLRAGYDNPEQIFELLPMFEGEGVDYLVLHPRTVVQKYEGYADHSITQRVVAATPLPIIANGDVVNAQQGLDLLETSGAAGLMIGRGAIADPLIFKRLRGQEPAQVSAAQKKRDACVYLNQVLVVYEELFCGDQQVLGKLKGVVSCFADPSLQHWVRRLRHCKTLPAFVAELED